ncbi:MAG: efflux RND transporter periplasmic adaptor subunit [Sulfurovum sp.]|nr:efflux RND transporter periplasmic adaptor subunit [Sulfurovum sp.]
MKRLLFTILLLAGALQAEDIYATFNVEAARHADLAFTATGIVGKINVEVASVVKEGEVLAALENSDAKAALEIAKTTLKFAKRDYERQRKVKKLVDAAKFDSYAFKYERAKAELALKQALYDKTLLKAPFDGVVYEKKVEKGDAVSGAMIRTVLKVQSLHKRKLVLEIDQKYWKMIKPGLTFTYRVDGDTKTYTGTIDKVYPYADSNNRKIKAEIEAEGFTPGLFGDGYIIIPDTK